MKFVVTRRRKDMLQALPAEERAELMKAGLAFVEKQKAAGKLIDIYSDVDLKGGGSTWEVESATELAKILTGSPVHSYYDLDIKPVVDVAIGIKV